MIWHLFKKDWRLLHWFVALNVLVHVLTAVAQLGPAGGMLGFLVTALLIVFLVHQDALPGVRQDWLVRPIRRADLLAAKFLFVLVTVTLPLFAIDIVQGLILGFAFGPLAAAALARSLYTLAVFSVPVFALAAMTRNLAEVAVAGAVWLFVLLVLAALPGLAGWTPPTTRTGVAWVPATTRQIVLLAGALAVVWVAYFRRQTLVARILFAVAVLVSQSSQFVPWSVAFAVQAPLSADGGDARDVALAFDAGLGRFRPAPGQNVNDVEERPGFGSADVESENQRRRAEGAVTVFVPLRVRGLPAESSLVADRSHVRLVDGDEVVFEGEGNALEVRVGTEAATSVGIHHGIRIPRPVFNQLGDRPIRLELDYYLTTFRRETTTTMPALDGDRHIPNVGRCLTELTAAETAVLFNCVTPGEFPPCVTIELQHPPSGRRNPEVSLCAPSYRPFPGHVLPDAMSRFRGRLPFADPSGLARYPVDGSRLAEAQVFVSAYDPREHFVERLVVPAFRPEAWRPEVPEGAQP